MSVATTQELNNLEGSFSLCIYQFFNWNFLYFKIYKKDFKKSVVTIRELKSIDI